MTTGVVLRASRRTWPSRYHLRWCGLLSTRAARARLERRMEKAWDPSLGIQSANEGARELHTTTPTSASTWGTIGVVPSTDKKKYTPLPPLDYRGRVVGAADDKPKAKPRAKRATTKESGLHTILWSDGGMTTTKTTDKKSEDKTKRKSTTTRTTTTKALRTSSVKVAAGSGAAGIGAKETVAVQKMDSSIVRKYRPRTPPKPSVPREDHNAGLPDRGSDPPITTLPLVIDPKKWKAAREANSFFSYKMYQGPPVAPSTEPTQVAVNYCKTLAEMEDVCEKYFMDEKVIGVDLEWQVDVRWNLQDDPRQHVSLIQISSPTRVALFHVALFQPQAPDGPDGGALTTIPTPDDLVAPSFRTIMKDPSVLKLGVCILGDTSRLKKHLGMDCVGMFELSNLWRVVRYRPHLHLHKKITRAPIRLALQVQDILGLPMYKDSDVRRSNWTRELSEAQIEYSVTDAFSYIQLFYVMEQDRLAMENPPPRPGFAESKSPLEIGDISKLLAAAAEAADVNVDVPVTEEDMAETNAQVVGEYDAADVDGEGGGGPEVEREDSVGFGGGTMSSSQVLLSHTQTPSAQGSTTQTSLSTQSSGSEEPIVDLHAQESSIPVKYAPDPVPDEVASGYYHHQDGAAGWANAQEYELYREGGYAAYEYAPEYTQEYEEFAGHVAGDVVEEDATDGVEYTPEYAGGGWAYTAADSPLPPPTDSAYEFEPEGEAAFEVESEYGSAFEVRSEAGAEFEVESDSGAAFEIESEAGAAFEVESEYSSTKSEVEALNSESNEDILAAVLDSDSDSDADAFEPVCVDAKSSRGGGGAVKTETGSRTEGSKPEAQTGSKTEAEVKAKAESETKVKAKAEANVETEAKEVKAKTETKAEAKVETEVKAKAETEAKVETEAMVETEAKTAVKTRTLSRTRRPSSPSPSPSRSSSLFRPFRKSIKDPRVVLAETLVTEYVEIYGQAGFDGVLPPPSSPSTSRSSSTPDDGVSSTSNDDIDGFDDGMDSDSGLTKRAAHVALRAYFLWRANLDLSPACIGELLRDPPLSPRTVGSYIAQAVRREKLPYDAARFHGEIMAMIPRSLWTKARPTH